MANMNMSNAMSTPSKTIPMDYDTYFNWPHYANTQVPYQFTAQLTFTTDYVKNSQYDVTSVVSGGVVGVSYSENVTLGYSTYDMLVPKLSETLLKQPIASMPSVPNAIKLAVFNACFNLINNNTTTFNGPIQLPHPTIQGQVISTNYNLTTSLDADGNNVFTVSGSWGGLRKFVDELPTLYIPPELPQNVITWNNMAIGQYNPSKLNNIPVAVPDTISYPGSHYYEIAAVEYSQKLHSDLKKPTRLRGFVQVTSHDANGMPIYNPAHVSHLGPLVFAKKDIPVRVKLYNLLSTGSDGNLPIPCDKTFMGCGQGPLENGENYTENRVVIHLHGGNTPWNSDGTANQWITPAGEMTSYKQGMSVVPVPDMPQPIVGDGTHTYYYTNDQTCRFMWYHDHSLGITRLNVYMGLVSGYSLSDNTELSLMDDIHLPDVDHTLPLILQEKIFVPDDVQMQMTDPTWIQGRNSIFPQWGQESDLWFPHVWVANQNPNVPANAHNFGRLDYGPWFWPPFTGIQHPETIDEMGRRYPSIPNPSGVAEAFCDTPLVNGVAYPYVNVERRTYRFNILNAYNDRFVNLSLFKSASNSLEDVSLAEDGTIIPIHLDSGEASMKPAVPGQPGWPETWPVDGRDGGVPDPATVYPHMWQIQNECGFIPDAVHLPGQAVAFEYNRRNIVVLDVAASNLYLCPAERASVIIDFSHCNDGDIILLYNDAPCPNAGFDPRNDYFTGNPDGTGGGGAPSTLKGYGPNTRTLLQFRVSGLTKPHDAGMIPNLSNTVKNAFLDCGQEPPIVPDAVYSEILGHSNRVGDVTIYENQDNYVRLEDNFKTFINVNDSARGVATVDPLTGAVSNIDVKVHGTDYIRGTTTVRIDPPPNAVQAKAKAVVTKDANSNTFQVSNIIIENPGLKYSSAPNIYIGKPMSLDVQATAIATINEADGTIIAITPNSDNFGYYSSPNVSIDPPAHAAGIPATAVANVENGRIVSFTITNPGSLYCGGLDAPNITIDAPTSSVLTEAGANDAVAAAGMTGMTIAGMMDPYMPPITAVQATATSTIDPITGEITSISITNSGSGYDPDNLPAIFIDKPTSAYVDPADITYSEGYIVCIKVVDNGEYSGGQDYSPNTILQVVGGYGDGGVLIPTLSTANTIQKIVIRNPGYGYQVAPLVTIDPPTMPNGIQATAEATIDERGQINNVIITNPGYGYEGIPDVGQLGIINLPNIIVTPVKPPNFSLPSVNFQTSAGSIMSVDVINGGFGYFNSDGSDISMLGLTIIPKLTGKTKVNAVGYANVKNGIITDVVITNNGSGYINEPIVNITLPNGVRPISNAELKVNFVPPGGIYKINFNTDQNGKLMQGSGFSSTPIMTIVDPGYVDPNGQIILPGGKNVVITFEMKFTTSIESIKVTNGGSGYDPANPPKVSIIDTKGIRYTYDVESPSIIEEFEPRYGRMNATFGTEIKYTNKTIQTAVPMGFADPPASVEKFIMAAYPMQGPTRADGTRLYKIIHNGVDTHSVHYHLMQIQLVNRIGWDGMITPPEPYEYGWKESLKMKALQLTVVAMRPVVPKLPFAVPDSVRPYSTVMPVGMSSVWDFVNVDEFGQPVTTTNDVFNYGHEYMYHCHILGHEENDMMRAFAMSLKHELPYKPIVTVDQTSNPNAVIVNWSVNKTPPSYMNYDPKDFYDIIIERCPDDKFSGNTNVVVADVRGSKKNLMISSNSFADTELATHPGSVAFYRITTINSAGLTRSAVYPIVVKLMPHMTYTITRPVGSLEAQVNLSWSSIPGLNVRHFDLVVYNNGVLDKQVTLSSSTFSYVYIPPITNSANHIFNFELRGVVTGVHTEASIASILWDVPNTPTGLKYTYNSTTKVATISWDPYVNSNSIPATDLTLSVNSNKYTLPLTTASYNYNFAIGTTYNISLTANNLIGPSTPATLTVAWRVPNAPSSILYDIASSQVKLSQVLIANSPDITNYAITLIDTFNGISNTTSVNVAYAPPATGTTAIGYISLIPELGHTYSFTIIAQNIVGNSSNGIYTLDWDVPNVPVVNVTKTAVTWTEVMIPAEPPVIEYDVNVVDTFGGNSTTLISVTVPASSLAFPWSPQLEHVYSISVSARNIVGTSLPGVYNCTWNVPDVPTFVNVTSTLIDWNAPVANGTPAVTSYTLQITNTYNGSTTNYFGSPFTINAPTTSKTWSPTTNHTYNMTLIANNVCGTSQAALYDVIWALPTTPSNIVLNNNGFTWTSTSFAPIIGYNVTLIDFDTVNNVSNTVTTTTTVASYPMLPEFQHQYTIYITAKTKAGSSSTANATYYWDVPPVPVILMPTTSSLLRWTSNTNGMSYPATTNYTINIKQTTNTGVISNRPSINTANTSITVNPSFALNYTYEVSVTATNSVGTSSPGILIFKWAAPDPVTNIIGDTTTNPDRIVWNASANPLVPAVTSYDVRSVLNGNTTTLANNTTNTYCTFTYNTVSNNQLNYIINVIADNGVATSTASTTIVVGPPSAPTNIVVSWSSISWTSNTPANALFPDTSYSVAITDNNTRRTTTTTTTNKIIPFSPSLNASYSIIVTAINGYTSSGGRNQTDSATYNIVWSKPNNVSNLAYNFTNNTLSWINGALIANSPPITNILVNGYVDNIASVSYSGSVSSSATSFNIPSALQSGSRYTWSVFPVNAVGGSISPPSVNAYALPRLAPTSVVYNTSTRYVSWTDAANALYANATASLISIVSATNNNNVIMNETADPNNASPFLVSATLTRNQRYTINVRVQNTYGYSQYGSYTFTA